MNIYWHLLCAEGFPGGGSHKKIGLPIKEITRYVGLIPGLGRPPGGGNGNPLQYSCLGNPMARRAQQAIVHGVTKIWT